MLFESWLDRPVEIKTLFNPMFCSIILNSALNSYKSEKGEGMPIPLSFLVLPLVCHSKTRAILPKMKNSSLGLWCKENENELIMLSGRIASLNKMTMMSLSLLKINDYVSIDNDAIDSRKNIKGVASYINLSAEINEIYLKAQFIGRWFANSGDVSMIYTYMGVRP